MCFFFGLGFLGAGGMNSASPGSPASTSRIAWLAGVPETKDWLAIISRVPRKLTLEGESNFGLLTRSVSLPSGPTTTSWSESRFAM